MGRSGPKLLDANAKLIAEFDFEGLLLLMGVEPGAKIIRIEDVQREMTLPQMRIDHGAKLTLEREQGRVVYIVEFLARWKSSAPLRLRKYSRAGEIKHECPVNGILVVCTSFRAPGKIPSRHSFGKLDRHPFDFTVFCPWKIPGEQILAMNRPRLLPLVALAEPNVDNGGKRSGGSPPAARPGKTCCGCGLFRTYTTVRSRSSSCSGRSKQ